MIYSAGSTQREAAYQCGQSEGVEGKADAGGAGQRRRETGEAVEISEKEFEYLLGKSIVPFKAKKGCDG